MRKNSIEKCKKARRYMNQGLSQGEACEKAKVSPGTFRSWLDAKMAPKSGAQAQGTGSKTKQVKELIEGAQYAYGQDWPKVGDEYLSQAVKVLAGR